MANHEASNLAAILIDAAKAIGAEITDAPDYLKGDKFNSEVLSDAISGSNLRRQESELPQSIEG